MSSDSTPKRRTRRPVAVSIEEPSGEQISLELDIGTQQNPIGFLLKTPKKDFRTELTYLLLQLPALMEQLLPQSEFPTGQELVRFVAGAYTLTLGDGALVVDTSMGNVTVSLPSATAMGKRYVIVKETSDANTVTVTPFGNDTIEASSSKTLSARWSKAILESDGVSNWLDLGSGLV